MDLCSHHIETSQLIYRANQLTGFYMMGTLVVKVLIISPICKNKSFHYNSVEKRVTSSDILVTSSNPRVASSNQRVTSLNTRVRRLKARVVRLKARVRRLKARVQAIKPPIK